MVDLDRLPLEHVTVTGHDPAVVLPPTLQVHDTTPDALAVLAPRPAAVADPDLYSTSIEHFARDAVLTVTVALAPAVMGEVNRVIPSFRVALGVGGVVGSAVGAGVGSAGRDGALVTTGEALGAGSGVAAGGVGAEVAVTAATPVGLGSAVRGSPTVIEPSAMTLMRPATMIAALCHPVA